MLQMAAAVASVKWLILIYDNSIRIYGSHSTELLSFPLDSLNLNLFDFFLSCVCVYVRQEL